MSLFLSLVKRLYLWGSVWMMPVKAKYIGLYFLCTRYLGVALNRLFC